ncbi:MAG: aminotransferase class I/II-fold pyridoxal phosphate-dependent enzyme [Actinophytocola sp.]|uniref:aminotransferase class I/II-fold pyridoxal phosphate-dependent enzyme n=1 Tax=Actinophytocola sp. TaxID=1872138 RepID=UPI003D6A940C
MIVSESRLERFFAQWEFSVEHILCASDVDGPAMTDLLALADDDIRARWDTLSLGYTETAGDPALRAEIARRYDAVSADDVVVCAGGAAEALFLVMNVLLEPATHAAVVWPAFEPLHNVARALGADVTPVPLDATAGWSLDFDALRRAVRPETRAIVVNFPHNPTGALLDAQTFAKVADLAREHDIPLVSDEVYRFTEFDPASRLPAAADVDDQFVSIGVMSKAYGLAGLRIGWVVTRDRELRRRILALKDYTSVCSAAPSEILAIIALRAHERIVAGCNALVAENLALVDAFFDRWPGLFDWTRPVAGTVGFPRLRAPVPVERFVTELMEREGVLLLPGTFFDDQDNRFRIGLGKRAMATGLEKLDHFIEREYAAYA